jgi:1-acyl-sn-glycerol-3-phosphate acyltransferase
VVQEQGRNTGILRCAQNDKRIELANDRLFAGTVSAAVRAGRLVRSVARSAVLVGLLVAATVDGRVRHALGLVRDGAEGAVWIHGWCRRIVRCLGIGYEVQGDLPGQLTAAGGRFEAVVCNHLSYIDILLMSAVRPFCMVAKTEVCRWPLLGWLTAQAGTVYVDRGGKPETYPRVNAAMAEAHRSGLPVLFFPEGTTTDGLLADGVLPFRRGLFHSVLKDEVQVRTAAIRYEIAGENENATVANDVCWWGDAEFVPHMFRFLGLRGVRAAVQFGGVVEGTDRFELAVNGRDMVAGMYGELGRLRPTHGDAMDGAPGQWGTVRDEQLERRDEVGLVQAL